MLIIDWRLSFLSEVGEVPTRGFWLLSQSLLWESANAPNRWVWHSCLHLNHLRNFFPVIPSPSSMQACLISLERPWWNSTAQSVWTCTPPNLPDIITQTEPILGQVSPTCCSWCTQSIGQSGQPTSLSRGAFDCVWGPLQATLLRFHVMLCVGTWTFLFLFQAVRFQNSPDGLSAPTPGRVKLQEPSEDDSLTLTTAPDSVMIVYVFEAVDYMQLGSMSVWTVTQLNLCSSTQWIWNGAGTMWLKCRLFYQSYVGEKLTLTSKECVEPTLLPHSDCKVSKLQD